MPNRHPYIGAPAGSAEGPGTVKSFAINPGPKWARANGAVLDVAAYPALAKQLGRVEFAAEYRYGSNGLAAMPADFHPLWGPVVRDPSAPNSWLSYRRDGSTPAHAFATSDNGRTWSRLATFTRPNLSIGYFKNDWFSAGADRLLLIRVQYQGAEYDEGYIESRQYDFHVSTNRGVTWTRAPNGGPVTLENANGQDHLYPLEPVALIFAEALGLFVLLTKGRHIYTSPDGLSWTRRGVQHEAEYLSCDPADGRLYAWQNGTTRYLTSADGITWTSLNSTVMFNTAVRGPRRHLGGYLYWGQRRTLDGFNFQTWLPTTVAALDPDLVTETANSGTPIVGARIISWAGGEGGPLIFRPGSITGVVDFQAAALPPGFSRFQAYTTSDGVTWKRGQIELEGAANGLLSTYDHDFGDAIMRATNGTYTARLVVPGLVLPRLPSSSVGTPYIKLRE